MGSTLFGALSARSRERLRQKRQPRRLVPMLATLTDSPFSDPTWVYERKLDGMRCLVFRTKTKTRLVSRNGQSLNATFPELVAKLDRMPCNDFVADGEVVAFEGRRTSFATLQQRIGIHDAASARASAVSVHLYLFDLPYLEGYDTTQVPLRERKALLKNALTFEGPVHFTPHRNERGVEYLKTACSKRWEGLIAKRASSTYVHGRSRSWLKFKCVNRQELVIGGYTDPRGERHGFGALLVGYHEDGALRFAGKVGTGYDAQTLRQLGARLKKLERKRPPFDSSDLPGNAHFVRPELVAEIAFTEWTRDGKLRHPRFVGLRSDKKATSVRRETPPR